MMKTRLQKIRLLLVGLVTATLVACGGSDSQSPSAQVSFLLSYMKSSYLWTEQLPANPSANDYETPEQALEALKIDDDRYSFITSATEYRDFFAGRLVGFGINFRYLEDDSAFRLRLVQPNSPANAAGLRRNDLVTAVDDKAVGQWIADDQRDQMFGPSEAGITRKFTLTRDGTQMDISVTKDNYQLAYVPATSVIDNAGTKVGYINFYSFSDAGVNEWNNALDTIVSEGARDLIVDLRFNGGGLLATAAQIGSSLGTTSLQGQVMANLTHNQERSSNNRSFRFITDSRAGQFDNLVWLTSNQTCSASESLIVGLDASRSATRIGQTTCGKPVGFTPQEFADKIFSIVVFRLESSAGETDYFNGLNPTCEVTDDGSGQLGEADEPLTAAALAYLNNGACPPTANAPIQAKQTRSASPAYSLQQMINLR